MFCGVEVRKRRRAIGLSFTRRLCEKIRGHCGVVLGTPSARQLAAPVSPRFFAAPHAHSPQGMRTTSTPTCRLPLYAMADTVLAWGLERTTRGGLGGGGGPARG